MTDPVAAREQLASALAKRAGQLALDYYSNRDSLEIETKASALDLVSIADRAVEDLIRDGIKAAFPDDGIVGEEGGAASGSSGYTWIIDPIDGTVPFLMGLPHWCVVIAVAKGSETLVGIIEVPCIGEHFAARKGQGARLNSSPLKLDPSKRINQVLVAVGANDRADRAVVTSIMDGLLASGGMFYRNGSGANMLANVAAGRLGGYIEPEMNSWDAVAGLLMIDEAGGVIQPFAADQAPGPVLGAAPGVWNDLEAIAIRSMGWPDANTR
ncbi:MAG: inositol monophosphatase family protein [Pseudomonadota bacterium]